MRELYCCSSYYQLFVSLMKVLTGKKQADLVLEVHGIGTASQLAERLRGWRGCIHQVFVCPDCKKVDPYRQRCASFLPCQRYWVTRHMEQILGGPLRGDTYGRIHVFWDLGYAGTYLNIRKIPYIIHEDSFNSYQHIRQNRPNYSYIFHRRGWKFLIKRYFHMGVIPFGYSPWCICVEVNEKQGIQIPLDKVKEEPRKILEKSLTEEEKGDIWNALRMWRCSDFWKTATGSRSLRSSRKASGWIAQRI